MMKEQGKPIAVIARRTALFRQAMLPRWLVVGLLLTTFAPLLLYVNLEKEEHGSTAINPHSVAMFTRWRKNLISPQQQQQQQQQPTKNQNLQQQKQQQQETTTITSPKRKKKRQDELLSTNNDIQQTSQHMLKAAKEAEAAILNFFHGETRALEDGVPFVGGGGSTAGGENSYSMRILSDRLAQRIWLCHTSHTTIDMEDSNEGQDNDDNNNTRKETNHSCTLRIVFVGSAQTSGRDNFYNQSFPFWLEQRLGPLAKAAGLELQVDNHAMDSDLSREGPQTNHMCIANLVGGGGTTTNNTNNNNDDNHAVVDVIGWDFDGNMQAKPSAQVEAFLRWASVLRPAMILINRGGPHGESRRGKRRVVVNISPGHNAIVYEDQDVLPSSHSAAEPYRNSSTCNQRWNNQRNSFWSKLMERYSSVMDLAAIDPVGSIWHLDHLEEFSNQALDNQKALPLLDCGSPGHDPPCDQVPQFIYNHLAIANLSNVSLPTGEATGGAVCGVLFGCRHNWYGGTRSHELRGELNALPIVQSLQHAAKAILSSAEETSAMLTKDAMATRRINLGRAIPTTEGPPSLPAPEFCSKDFCGRTPTCITSYIPNLGLQLGKSILIADDDHADTNKSKMPLLGASHFANRAVVQVNDLERRFAPLGYIDRKYAYRLAREPDEHHNQKKKKKLQNEEEIDVPVASIRFTAAGEGPLVLCEPPCFIDECSKKRKMPLVDHVTLVLDDNVSLPSESKHNPWAIEVGGKFCTVIAKSIAKGDHVLRIETNATMPDFVMFSHLISFA